MAKKRIYEFSYRYHTGTVAWILHRLSGIALILYLILHIWVIHNLNSQESFDIMMKFLNTPIFKFLELGLWAVIIYHTINGLRIIIVDFLGGSRIQKELFWGTIVVCVILFVMGAIPFISHIITIGG
jgi:succinate dehydrogenase / fumarate reductase cytochrome b subunit